MSNFWTFMETSCLWLIACWFWCLIFCDFQWSCKPLSWDLTVSCSSREFSSANASSISMKWFATIQVVNWAWHQHDHCEKPIQMYMHCLIADHVWDRYFVMFGIFWIQTAVLSCSQKVFNWWVNMFLKNCLRLQNDADVDLSSTEGTLDPGPSDIWWNANPTGKAH